MQIIFFCIFIIQKSEASKKYEEHVRKRSAQYKFSYNVSEEQKGLNFGHSEERKGNRVEGKYFVLLPDGRLQTVNYYADESGYHPFISYSEHKGYHSHAGVEAPNKSPQHPRYFQRRSKKKQLSNLSNMASSLSDYKAGAHHTKVKPQNQTYSSTLYIRNPDTDQSIDETNYASNSNDRYINKSINSAVNTAHHSQATFNPVNEIRNLIPQKILPLESPESHQVGHNLLSNQQIDPEYEKIFRDFGNALSNYLTTSEKPDLVGNDINYIQNLVQNIPKPSNNFNINENFRTRYPSVPHTPLRPEENSKTFSSYSLNTAQNPRNLKTSEAFRDRYSTTNSELIPPQNHSEVFNPQLFGRYLNANSLFFRAPNRDPDFSFSISSGPDQQSFKNNFPGTNSKSSIYSDSSGILNPGPEKNMNDRKNFAYVNHQIHRDNPVSSHQYHGWEHPDIRSDRNKYINPPFIKELPNQHSYHERGKLTFAHYNFGKITDSRKGVDGLSKSQGTLSDYHSTFANANTKSEAENLHSSLLQLGEVQDITFHNEGHSRIKHYDETKNVNSDFNGTTYQKLDRGVVQNLNTFKIQTGNQHQVLKPYVNEKLKSLINDDRKLLSKHSQAAFQDQVLSHNERTRLSQNLEPRRIYNQMQKVYLSDPQIPCSRLASGKIPRCHLSQIPKPRLAHDGKLFLSDENPNSLTNQAVNIHDNENHLLHTHYQLNKGESINNGGSDFISQSGPENPSTNAFSISSNGPKISPFQDSTVRESSDLKKTPRITASHYKFPTGDHVMTDIDNYFDGLLTEGSAASANQGSNVDQDSKISTYQNFGILSDGESRVSVNQNVLTIPHEDPNASLNKAPSFLPNDESGISTIHGYSFLPDTNTRAPVIQDVDFTQTQGSRFGTDHSSLYEDQKIPASQLTTFQSHQGQKLSDNQDITLNYRKFNEHQNINPSTNMNYRSDKDEKIHTNKYTNFIQNKGQKINSNKIINVNSNGLKMPSYYDISIPNKGQKVQTYQTISFNPSEDQRIPVNLKLGYNPNDSQKKTVQQSSSFNLAADQKITNLNSDPKNSTIQRFNYNISYDNRIPPNQGLGNPQKDAYKTSFNEDFNLHSVNIQEMPLNSNTKVIKAHGILIIPQPEKFNPNGQMTGDLGFFPNSRVVNPKDSLVTSNPDGTFDHHNSSVVPRVVPVIIPVEDKAPSAVSNKIFANMSSGDLSDLGKSGNKDDYFDYDYL